MLMKIKWYRELIGPSEWDGETPLYKYISSDDKWIIKHVQTSAPIFQGSREFKVDYWEICKRPYWSADFYTAKFSTLKEAKEAVESGWIGLALHTNNIGEDT